MWLHLCFISDALELLVQRTAAPIRSPEYLAESDRWLPKSSGKKRPNLRCAGAHSQRPETPKDTSAPKSQQTEQQICKAFSPQADSIRIGPERRTHSG